VELIFHIFNNNIHSFHSTPIFIFVLTRAQQALQGEQKNIMRELVWGVYTCLTQLYGGRDMYNLLHKEQLHVSALFIGHLQVDK